MCVGIFETNQVPLRENEDFFDVERREREINKNINLKEHSNILMGWARYGLRDLERLPSSTSQKTLSLHPIQKNKNGIFVIRVCR